MPEDFSFNSTRLDAWLYAEEFTPLMSSSSLRFAIAAEIKIGYNGKMFRSSKIAFIILLIAAAGGCSSGISNTSSNSPLNTAANSNSAVAEGPKPAATPSNQITEADVAKLKWLEGTWKGTGGQKPFYERIRFDGTTMIIETYSDESLSKVDETSRFELKDGEFGHTVNEQRSAASSITDRSVRFVPAAALPGGLVKGSTFRFERLDGGTWNATLEMPATSNRPASEKVYTMQPWRSAGK